MLDYQNPSLPVAQRVADLLSRMTLEEKAAQTCMMRGVEYASIPSQKQNCSVEPETEFDEEALARDFAADGVGFIHDMYSLPVAFNKIQKFLWKNPVWESPPFLPVKPFMASVAPGAAFFPFP